MPSEQVEAIAEAVAEAAKLRMPAPPTPERPASQVVQELADYMLSCAIKRAELMEHRITLSLAVEALEDRWDTIEGWEAVAGGSRVTEAQRDAAKRTLDDATWGALRDGKRLLKRLDAQVGRLCGKADDEIASRAYSLLAGA